MVNEPYDSGDQQSAESLPPLVCLRCGSIEFEPGFIDDVSQGRVRWIEGAVKLGVWSTRKLGRARRVVEAFRCVRCNRLELFADIVQ